MKTLHPVTEEQALNLIGYTNLYDLLDFITHPSPLDTFTIRYTAIGMLTGLDKYCPQWEELGYWTTTLKDFENNELLTLLNGTLWST